MKELNEKELAAMLRYTEGVLNDQLAKDPGERDAEVVDECLETMVLVRQQLDELAAKNASVQNADARRTPKSAAQRRAEQGCRTSRVSIRRLLLTAAIIATILVATLSTAGVADNSYYFKVGNFTVFKEDDAYVIRYGEEAEPVDNEPHSDEPHPPVTLEDVPQLKFSSEDELLNSGDPLLMYPTEHEGLEFESATAYVDEMGSSYFIVLHRSDKEIFDVSIHEHLVPTSLEQVGYVGNCYFDEALGVPRAGNIAGYDCVVAECRLFSYIVLAGDNFVMYIDGRARLSELEQIITSMLPNN